jgi:hypothetical protein
VKQTVIRVLGIVVILAALWTAMSAVFGMMPFAWSHFTGETNHLYKYGTWIDLSIWAAWGLLVFCAAWAIRILLRHTKNPSEGV